MFTRRRLMVGIAAVVMSGILLASCGRSQPSAIATLSPTVTPTPTPAELLAKAATAMQGVSTVEFSLGHEKGSTPLLPGLAATSFQGQVAMPDRVQVSMKAEVAVIRTVVEIKVIVIAGKAYMTDPVTGAWHEIPVDNLPLNFQDLANKLGDIAAAANSPQYTGADTVEGVQTTRVSASVGGENLQTLIPSAIAANKLKAELWVEKGTWLIRKARLVGPIVSEDSPDVVRVLVLRSFGKSVDISPPPQ